MSDYLSIESLLNQNSSDDDDEKNPQAKLAKKQQEIKIKEVEKKTQALAEEAGLEYVNLVGFPISPDAITLIEEEEAKEKKAVCFYYDGENIRVATTDPYAKEAKEVLKRLNEEHYTQGKLYLVSQHSFDYALEIYENLPKVTRMEGGVEIKEEDLKKFKETISSYQSLNEKINEVNTSDIVTLILATALKVNSSDIHIEAEDKGIIIRLRIDGVLQEAAVVDKEKWKKITSRMKILAGVKINIADQPQDGRFSIFVSDEKIDVRISFLPTAYGESVVMRLLRSKGTQLPFEKLGLRKEMLKVLKEEISKPNGLVLTTGPTGSGKTTTLYSILNKLNQPGTKIITLENPVEYQLKGINQSQIDHKKDYTFAKGLRSILRQDPDIIMVGEIRDLETAEIAIQASLTGHLVLSTLHTNDASGVIPRLIDMGVKPHFLTPAVNAVIGQRLIRKLCPHCREEHTLNEEEENQVKKILAVMSPKSGIDTPSQLPTVYKAGEGCAKCNYIGYKGRIGIYEVFTMDDKIKQLTADKAPAFKILQQAIENGMVTMLQDGVLKALEGITSLKEIYRVIGKFDYIDELYDVVISQTVGRGIKIKEEQLEEIQKLTKDLYNLKDQFKETPTKELPTKILGLAVASDTGDIHIEPTSNEVKVRFRIDGVLHDIISLPKETYLPLLSKFKILIGVETNVKKPTIDGRFSIKLPDQKIDCRVSIISGGYGETVVIRILSNATTKLELESLGLKPYTLKPLNNSIQKTKGIIITTGPTGSGKTTTLYSILNILNKPDVKIITVEDPIEYQMDGLLQTQIDKKQGYTFASAMKSLLRQNPNIMMVGEIRDKETASMSIEASMTGHLVLSTIHANSAAGAISRFSGLGIERQMLANAIQCSIGQRLVRKVCPHCKQETEIDNQTKEEIKNVLDSISPKANVEIPKEIKAYKGSGCEKCNNIGYKGRLGVYEVFEITPELQKTLQKSEVTDQEIEQKAVEGGAVTMIQDGILKVLKGETTVEEIFRVLK